MIYVSHQFFFLFFILFFLLLKAKLLVARTSMGGSLSSEHRANMLCLGSLTAQTLRGDASVLKPFSLFTQHKWIAHDKLRGLKKEEAMAKFVHSCNRIQKDNVELTVKWW